MQVDCMTLDAPQGDSHVAEGQCRQSAAGAILHPGKVVFANQIGQIVEAIRLIINFPGATYIFIVKGFADPGEETQDLLMECVDVIPGVFTEIKLVLIETLHV